MLTCEERNQIYQDRKEQHEQMSARAQLLKEIGFTNVQIAKTLGVAEGTVRNLVKEL